MFSRIVEWQIPLEVTTIRRQLKPPSMHVLILSVMNQMNCEKNGRCRKKKCAKMTLHTVNACEFKLLSEHWSVKLYICMPFVWHATFDFLFLLFFFSSSSSNHVRISSIQQHIELAAFQIIPGMLLLCCNNRKLLWSISLDEKWTLNAIRMISASNCDNCLVKPKWAKFLWYE